MKRKLIISGIIAVIVGALLSGAYVWHMNRDDLHLQSTAFNHLPGWANNTNASTSLSAFKRSCKVLLNQKPDTQVGSPYIPLTAKDWYPSCRAALQVDAPSPQEANAFFEHWFTPVEFVNHKPLSGLFTGYYVAQLHGSLTKTKEYKVPLYGLPDNLLTIKLSDFDPTLVNRRLVGRLQGKTVVPYYTREEINQGAIAKSAPVIVWVNSHIDRLFLEIQGSGIVQLTDGSHMVVGYAGQNGASYTAVAGVLIKMGVMTTQNASMQGIRDYLDAHPEQIDTVINHNKSFVFFQRIPRESVVGVQNIALTPGFSLAVDRRWIPIGIPIWLNTTRPTYKPGSASQVPHGDLMRPLQRLMIAQDTGGAIRGMVRGDVFWGAGDKATEIAGKMKNTGHYWLFLPKSNPTLE